MVAQSPIKFSELSKSAQLALIAENFVTLLSCNPELRDDLIENFVSYHGFDKVRFPDDLLEYMLKPYGLTSDDLQIELVRITVDMTHQVHHHDETTADCTALGEEDGFPDPQNSWAFFENGWAQYEVGDRLEIAPGVLHGFTIYSESEQQEQKPGILYFLSIQGPPLVGHGKDDFHQHEQTPVDGNIVPKRTGWKGGAEALSACLASISKIA